MATLGAAVCRWAPGARHVRGLALAWRRAPALAAQGAPWAPRRCFAAPSELERYYLSLASPSRVHDVVNPRLATADPQAEVVEERTASWVSDVGRLLDEEDRRQIDALCQEVNSEWRMEVVVVVLDSLPESVRPAGFAAALLNYWGVGDKRLHTGVLALLLLGQRRLEVRTGFGAGRVLKPGVLRAIQEERVIPQLRANAPGEGLAELVRGVRDALATDGPRHWKQETAKGDVELNGHGFGGGQTPIDEFLPEQGAGGRPVAPE